MYVNVTESGGACLGPRSPRFPSRVDFSWGEPVPIQVLSCLLCNPQSASPQPCCFAAERTSVLSGKFLGLIVRVLFYPWAWQDHIFDSIYPNNTKQFYSPGCGLQHQKNPRRASPDDSYCAGTDSQQLRSPKGCPSAWAAYRSGGSATLRWGYQGWRISPVRVDHGDYRQRRYEKFSRPPCRPSPGNRLIGACASWQSMPKSANIR